MGGNRDQDRSQKHVNDAAKEIGESTSSASKREVKEQLNDRLTYITNDRLVANPYAILGAVFYEDKQTSELRQYIYNVPIEIDPDSKLTAPLVRKELVVSWSVAAEISVLSMLTVGGSAENMYEFRILDNNVGGIKNDRAFRESVRTWAKEEETSAFLIREDIGRVMVVTGVAQKYVSQKRFKKYTAEAKGGAWGVQVDGSVYLSDSDYSLDILYGLDLLVYQEADGPDQVQSMPASATSISKTPELQTMLSERLSRPKAFGRAFR